MLEKFLKNGKKNMEYSIKLANQFLDEFEEICDYISNKLKNIDASNRLREKLGLKWQIRDKSAKRLLTEHLEIVIIELPKPIRQYKENKKDEIIE